MNWVIHDQNTLKELDTGFVIKLIEGTWFHPRDIYPIAPPGMGTIEQARMLRLGLKYIETLSTEQLAG